LAKISCARWLIRKGGSVVWGSTGASGAAQKPKTIAYLPEHLTSGYSIQPDNCTWFSSDKLEGRLEALPASRFNADLSVERRAIDLTFPSSLEFGFHPNRRSICSRIHEGIRAMRTT